MSAVEILRPAVRKRLEKDPHAPGRHGTCPVCGKGWDTCPHTWDDVDAVRTAYAVEKASRL